MITSVDQPLITCPVSGIQFFSALVEELIAGFGPG
jgi:hypothetical protein